jgi:hypothetical protein
MRGTGVVTNVFDTSRLSRLLLDELDSMVLANERIPAKGFLFLQAHADLLLIEQIRLFQAMKESQRTKKELSRCFLERQALAFQAERAAKKWGYEADLPLDFLSRSFKTSDGQHWLWNDMVKRGVYEMPAVWYADTRERQ